MGLNSYHKEKDVAIYEEKEFGWKGIVDVSGGVCNFFLVQYTDEYGGKGAGNVYKFL